jgi:hypothetical protein
MSIRNVTFNPIDLLRLPRPQGERRKSIGSPWGWGRTIDFQAKLKFLSHIPDTHFILQTFKIVESNGSFKRQMYNIFQLQNIDSINKIISRSDRWNVCIASLIMQFNIVSGYRGN